MATPSTALSNTQSMPCVTTESSFLIINPTHSVNVSHQFMIFIYVIIIFEYDFLAVVCPCPPWFANDTTVVGTYDFINGVGRYKFFNTFDKISIFNFSNRIYVNFVTKIEIEYYWIIGIKRKWCNIFIFKKVERFKLNIQVKYSLTFISLKLIRLCFN